MNSAAWLWWAPWRAPSMTSRRPSARRRSSACGADPERGRRERPDELEHRDGDRGERVEAGGGRVLGGVELAQDRRRGGGAERPDRVGAERRQVGGGHPDGLGHEPGEHAVEVARGEVLAQPRLEGRVDRLLARRQRARPRTRRRAGSRRSAGSPRARCARPASARRRRRARPPRSARTLGDGGEVVELALDVVGGRVPVAGVAASAPVDGVEPPPRGEVRSDAAPGAVVGGRAVDQDQRPARRRPRTPRSARHPGR